MGSQLVLDTIFAPLYDRTILVPHMSDKDEQRRDEVSDDRARSRREIRTVSRGLIPSGATRRYSHDPHRPLAKGASRPIQSAARRRQVECKTPQPMRPGRGRKTVRAIGVSLDIVHRTASRNCNANVAVSPSTREPVAGDASVPTLAAWRQRGPRKPLMALRYKAPSRSETLRIALMIQGATKQFR